MDDLITRLTAAIDETERVAREGITEVGYWRKGDVMTPDMYRPDKPPASPEYHEYDAFPHYPWGSGERELTFMTGPGHPDDVLRGCAADRKMLAAVQRRLDGHPGPHDYELPDGTEGYGGCDLCYELSKTTLSPDMLPFMAERYGIEP